MQTNIPIHHEYKVPKLPPPSLASSEEDLAEAIIHPPTPSVRNQETPLTQTIGTEEKKKEPKEPELLWTNTEMDKDTELDELDKLWDSGSRLLSETEHTPSDFGRPTSSIKSNQTLFSFERETDWSGMYYIYKFLSLSYFSTGIHLLHFTFSLIFSKIGTSTVGG